MRFWVLLALISLVNAETTTETTIKENTESSTSSDTKEKRAPTDQTSIQNANYEYLDKGHGSQDQDTLSAPIKDQLSHIFHKQSQPAHVPAKPQDPGALQVTYVPLESLLAGFSTQIQPPKDYFDHLQAKKQQQPGDTTFTIHYIPASSTYPAVGNTHKYELISKIQQAPTKVPDTFVQKQLQYILPTQGYSYLYPNAQYSAAQAHSAYIIPHVNHPAQYIAPAAHQQHPRTSGGIVYTLQPVVMTFAMPGSYAPIEQNPPLALSVLGGDARKSSAANAVYHPYPSPVIHRVPYFLQREQVAYVLPPSHASFTSQHIHQQAVTPRTLTAGNVISRHPSQNAVPAYPVRGQSTPHFQQMKG